MIKNAEASLDKRSRQFEYITAVEWRGLQSHVKERVGTEVECPPATMVIG